MWLVDFKGACICMARSASASVSAAKPKPSGQSDALDGADSVLVGSRRWHLGRVRKHGAQAPPCEYYMFCVSSILHGMSRRVVSMRREFAQAPPCKYYVHVLRLFHPPLHASPGGMSVSIACLKLACAAPCHQSVFQNYTLHCAPRSEQAAPSNLRIASVVLQVGEARQWLCHASR